MITILNITIMQKISRTKAVKSIISSSIGNVLEWYEYALYAYFSTVISTLFFPNSDRTVGMILTFATFAIGLAARPIGGIIFGYIGDRYGRRKMLTFTILMMSIPTMCIGLLPTYEKIGIAAPLILICLRLVQGVALGGEFGASCTYLYESVSQKHRGFFGTFALTGVGTGLILSALTIHILESFVSEDVIYQYAWRIPFFISVFGSFIGFYMRKNLLETQDFVMLEQSSISRAPFIEMIAKYKVTILGLFTIFLTTQIAFYVVFIFGKTMMVEYLGFDVKTAGMFNLYTVISYTVATVIFGYMADKVNKKYIILLGLIAMFVSSCLFIDAMQSGVYIKILLMSILFGVLIGMTEGTLNPVVAESFPVHIRATSVAFCWNFTAIFFGGIAPIISMWLIDKTANPMSVGYYLMAVSGISIIGTVSMIFAQKFNSKRIIV